MYCTFFHRDSLADIRSQYDRDRRIGLYSVPSRLLFSSNEGG